MHQSRVSGLDGLGDQELGKIISLEDLLTALREHLSDEGGVDVEDRLRGIYNAIKFNLEPPEGIVDAYTEDKIVVESGKRFTEMLEEVFRRLIQEGILDSKIKSVMDVPRTARDAVRDVIERCAVVTS